MDDAALGERMLGAFCGSRAVGPNEYSVQHCLRRRSGTRKRFAERAFAVGNEAQYGFRHATTLRNAP